MYDILQVAGFLDGKRVGPYWSLLWSIDARNGFITNFTIRIASINASCRETMAPKIDEYEWRFRSKLTPLF